MKSTAAKKTRPHRAWLVLGALLLAAVGLAACSPGDSPTPSPAAPVTTLETGATPMVAGTDMVMGGTPMMTATAVMTGTPLMAATEMGGMDMGEMGEAPAVPAGLAYAEGEEIRFMHTEVSDPDIAELLSGMMDSPVLHVPALADAPDSMLATVYVFTNGPAGMGPLGFQPDVFDNPPGTDGYSPLRKIVLVTWADDGQARELKSADEVQAAIDAGELTAEEPGVVVNMPFVTWPGGER